jgi:hypothetical protein
MLVELARERCLCPLFPQHAELFWEARSVRCTRVYGSNGFNGDYLC